MPSVRLSDKLEACRQVEPNRTPATAAPPAPWENPALKVTTQVIQEALRKDVPALMQSTMLTENAQAEVMARIRGYLRDDGSLWVPGYSQDHLAQAIFDHVAGLGPLQSLLIDGAISEIMVNRPDDVWVEVEGRLTRREDVRLRDDMHILHIATRVLAPLGVELSAARPLARGRLPGNVRVAAAIPPLTRHPTINIRKMSLAGLTPAELSQEFIRRNSAPSDLIHFLYAAAKACSNMVIAGPTGTGKTTLARIIGSQVPQEKRLLVLEQLAELGLENYHSHVVPYEVNSTDLTLDDCLKHAMHCRPDYLVVGEIIGAECLTFLTSLYTGHPGMTTLHANSAEEVFPRLSMAMSMARLNILNSELLSYTAQALDLIIYMQRFRNGQRKITHVTEVQGLHGSEPQLRHLWEFVPSLITDEVVQGEYRLLPPSDRLATKIRMGGGNL